MVDSFVSWFIGKGLDYTWDRLKMKNNQQDISLEIKEIISSSVKDTVTKYNGIDEWNEEDFFNYLVDQIYNFENNTSMDFWVREVVKTYLEIETIGIEITENWMCVFRENCIKYISQKASISNYFVLCMLEERRRREEQITDESMELINVIKKDINECRKTDMYDGITMINRTIYPYVCRKLTKGCSSGLLELAYGLTDIYDHISEYEKSTTLAKMILMVEKTSNTQFSARHFQILIGCTYSLVIEKDVDVIKKEEILQFAERMFSDIREKIDIWECMDNVDNSEKLFIRGLFESDLGALYTNKADIARKNGDNVKQKEYLEVALYHQNLGESARQGLINIVSEALDKDMSFDAKKRLYQSKSNIAGIYFRLGKYDEAIMKHKEILEYREINGEKSNAYLSKVYIVGCYIEKWKCGILSEIEKEICKRYASECEQFYFEHHDEMRLNDIRKKQDEISKLRLLEKTEDENDEEANNNF